MSFASLLVHVDIDADMGMRSYLAADLADRFDAVLIGLAGWSPMWVFPSQEARENPAAGDFHLQDMKSLLDQKGNEFCTMLGVKDRRIEWRSVLDFPTEAVAREARAADLVIIGNVKENKNPLRALDPASTILKSGRPVLVVPKDLSSFSPRRIAVAWKDVREARRAVRDALPFLQLAENVMLVEILEQGKTDGAAQHLRDLACYLGRQGIKIIAQQVRPRDVTAADSLIRFIEDENIDLVVAGAYGHSRLSEWALGGVTHALLAESPVCCLFSH